MSFELRPITGEEYLPFSRATGAAFGEVQSEEDANAVLPLIELHRTLAAFDGGEIVGTGILISFQMTLPGGTSVPVGGVSWIGVLPTHRRRGILTAIMAQELRDMRDRGEALGILWASESIIYGRYGYGLSSSSLQVKIDPQRGAFGRAPESSGRVRFIDKESAPSVIPPLYECYRLTQPGEITRSAERWKLEFSDPERWRDGASGMWYVGHEAENGKLDGYVGYRVKHNWDTGFPGNVLQVRNLAACTDQARADLWRYLLSVDLVSKVEVRCPVDEPLLWMLADPRRMQVTEFSDAIWTRLVDIPAALSARCYLSEDELVFSVVDPFCPENDGRYAVQGGPNGAECRRTGREPDLALQVTDLAAAYMGGTRFSTLARAGRVEECRPGALRRADLMFAAERAPWCQTGF
jgi:predicted acetyltransferase